MADRDKTNRPDAGSEASAGTEAERRARALRVNDRPLGDAVERPGEDIVGWAAEDAGRPDSVGDVDDPADPHGGGGGDGTAAEAERAVGQGPADARGEAVFAPTAPRTSSEGFATGPSGSGASSPAPTPSPDDIVRTDGTGDPDQPASARSVGPGIPDAQAPSTRPPASPSSVRGGGGGSAARTQEAPGDNEAETDPATTGTAAQPALADRRTTTDGGEPDTSAPSALVTIDGAVTGHVAEDQTLSVSGRLTGSGSDPNTPLTWRALNPASSFGTLTLSPDGTWTFDLANGNPIVQDLAEGQTLIQSFAVAATDPSGHTATALIAVTITGTNDTPVIESASELTGGTDEDGIAEATGLLLATDPDAGADLTWSLDRPDGTYGTLSVDPSSGSWTFRLDGARAATQGLNEGQVATDRFVVTVTDEFGETSTATVVVSVGGHNDGPTVAGSSVIAGTVAEDATDPTFSGNLVGMDPDSAAALTWSVSATDGVYGTVSIDAASGRWTYTLDNSRPATDLLGDGQTATEIFTATVTDEHGVSASQQITVTVTGSNDLPILGAPVPIVVDENDPLIRGQLVATDVETADADLTYSLNAPVNGFTLNSDGSYAFDPGHSAYRNLAAGQPLQLHIPVTVTDCQGGTDTEFLDITVTGTDDRPVLTLVPPMHADEDGAVFQGRLSATDPDTGDALTYSMPAPVNGFVLNADGSYRFDPSHPSYQYLADGEHRIVTVPVIVTDSTGATDRQDLQITITGTNDQPVLMVTPSQIRTEGGTAFGGTLRATDVDTSDVLTFHTGSAVAGFALNPGGSYTFDPADPAYDHLGVNQRTVLTIPVEVWDGAGGTASQTLQITLTGTNDRPLFAAVVRETATEDTTIRGRIVATDVDDGDGVTIMAVAPVPGLTLNPDGSFAFDAGNPIYQDLGDRQTRDLTIPIVATDRNGGQTQSQLHIQIVGTNDRPIVAGLDHAIAAVQSAQSGTVHIDGQLSVLDLDAGEAHFQPQLLTGSYGVLAIDSSGHWNYTADANQGSLVGLKPSDQVTESFVVRTADGTEHTIELAIKGENNLAIIGGVDASLLKEDVVGSVTQHLSIMDLDSNESSFVATDHDTRYGHFTLAKDGTWTYALNPQAPGVQGLAEGAMISERIVVGSADGTPHMITVNIVGTNDAPIIGAAGSGQVSEDQTATAQGTLVATDIDAGGRQTWSVAVPDGAYGSLSIDPQTGAWTYTLDPARAATQALRGNHSETERFSVTVTDEHGASAQTTVSVTVTGTNDAARISGTEAGSVREDAAVDAGGHLHTSGQLSVTDADTGESGFQAETIQGQYGALTIDAHGAWSFSADNSDPKIQALNTNQSVTDQFTVQTVDGTRKVIAVTIEGRDEHVTIGGVVAGDVKEDGVTTIVHQLTTSGGEHPGQASFVDTVIAGQYGSIDLRADGRWIYTLDNADPRVQALAEGETLTDTITVTAKDGATQDLTVTVTGSHDLPVISIGGGTPPASISDVTIVTELTAATDLSSFPEVNSGVATGMKIVGLYMPGSSVNELAGIDHAHLPSTHAAYDLGNVAAAGCGYQYLDGKGWFGQNLAGGPDRFAPLAPSLRNTWDGGLVIFEDGSVGRLTKVCEDSRQTGPGDYIYFKLIQGADAHQGLTRIEGSAAPNTQVVVLEGQTQLGAVQSDANGHWVFTSPLALSDGDHHLNTVIGGITSAPMLIHVVGGAATVTAEAAGLGSLVEGDAAHSVLGGQMTVQDVDATDNPVFAEQTGTTGTYGTFSIDANGHWTYQLDNSRAVTRGLTDGERQTETFTVQVTTASGETVERDVTVVVTGTNEVPTVSGDTTGVLTEDAAATRAGGALVLADIDSGDTATATVQTDVAGTYGTFSVDAAGHWTYTLDNTKAETQGLQGGQTETDTFTVTVTDANGGTTTQDVTITVTGEADAPVIAGATTGAVKEDATGSATGVLTVTDSDVGDSVSFTAETDVAGTYGSFSIDANGAWTYTLDNSKGETQALAEGEHHSESFTVTATDSSGQVTTRDVTITVTGTHEAPIVSGPTDFGTLDEDTTLAFSAADLLANAHIEGGGTLSVVAGSLTSPHGTITGDAAGGFVFHPAADYAGQGLQIAYRITDGSVEVDATASLDVASVTDAAAPTMTIKAEQEVMEFATGSAGAPGIVNTGTISAGGAMHGLTIDMTILGGQQIHTQDNHGATFISYATHSDSNAFYIWRPEDLTFRVGGTEYRTGVAMRTDGSDHRYTFSWDGDRGTLAVLVDGQVEAQLTGIGRGATIADGGKFALGNDQDSFGGGFSNNDAFTGQMFNVGIAKTAVPVDELQGNLLATVLDGHADLLTDIQAQGGQFRDATGRYQYGGVGDVRTSTVEVDTAIAAPNPGATLKLSLDTGAPSDADDTVTRQTLAGFASGTVVRDGSGHSVTVSSPADVVDITGWTTDSVEAVLPPTGRTNMNIGYTVTTTGPDGATVLATATTPIVLDPSQPTPDAVIAGDDTGSTDEDTAVSGQLTVADADAGEDHFTAETLHGNLGDLEIRTDGSWTYTPDDRADALTDGARDSDRFVVRTADGTTHTVVLTVTGADDGPVLQAQSQSVTEDDALLSGQMQATAPSPGETLTFSTTATVDGFTLRPDGSYTFDPSHSAYQSLADGEPKTLTIPVTVTDSTGLSSAQDLTITVTGAQDAAVISVVHLHDHFSAKEDANVNTSGKIQCNGNLAVVDADAGEGGVFPLQHGQAAYGTYFIAPSGAWSYTAENGQDAIQQLGDGQSLTDSFTVHSKDGTPHTITVKIEGTNDAPTVTATSGAAADLGATDEDTAKTFSEADLLQLVGAADVDGDALQVTGVSIDSSAGSFAKQADGSWMFTPTADFDGTHVPVEIGVSDGTTSTTAHATLDVDPVVGGATLTGASASVAPPPSPTLDGMADDMLSGAAGADVPAHPADPLDGYMAFASGTSADAAPDASDTSGAGDDTAAGGLGVDAVGGADADSVSDYLTAAGIDPNHLDPGTNAGAPAAGGVGNDAMVSDAAGDASDVADSIGDDGGLATVDLPDPVGDDDPGQHHGV